MNSQQDPKQRIIQKASDWMFRYGIKRLNMDMLSSELGMSKKTIYQFFKSKDDLVEQVIDHFVSSITSAQEEKLSQVSTPLEKISAIMTPVYRLLVHVDKIFTEDLFRMYPELWEKINAIRVKRLEKIRELISEGIWEGVFKPVDPEMAANLLTVSVTNFIHPENLERLNVTPAQALYFLLNTFFTGILSEDKKNSFGPFEPRPPFNPEA